MGHIFYFGKKYSESMSANVTLPNGTSSPVYMGSYGIGVSRLVGAIIESSHDDKGIIWPKEIAPFAVGIVNLSVGNEHCDFMSMKVYNMLESVGKDVLLDDTKESAGSKLASMDLIGIPYQIIIGTRYAKDEKYEVKNRLSGDVNIVALENIISFLG